MSKRSFTKAELTEKLEALNNELVSDNVRVPRRLSQQVQELKTSTGKKKQDIYTEALEFYFEKIGKNKKPSK